MSNLTPEIKSEIDTLTVGALLDAVRYAPAGDPRFVGERGSYCMDRLAELRKNNPGEYVHASKLIG